MHTRFLDILRVWSPAGLGSERGCVQRSRRARAWAATALHPTSPISVAATTQDIMDTTITRTLSCNCNCTGSLLMPCAAFRVAVAHGRVQTGQRVVCNAPDLAGTTLSHMQTRRPCGSSMRALCGSHTAPVPTSSCGGGPAPGCHRAAMLRNAAEKIFASNARVMQAREAQKPRCDDHHITIETLLPRAACRIKVFNEGLLDDMLLTRCALSRTCGVSRFVQCY
jgi:hypothetical protein